MRDMYNDKNTTRNPEGYNLISQVLNLFLKDHQFECHKPQGHWRLT